MKIIATLQGCEILLHNDGHISFLADCDIDCDGSGGNPEGDPYFQPDTTLHHEGKALDAYKVPFIVVPPAIVYGVPQLVMGCQARLHYRETGQSVMCVVGDLGPRLKVGEASVRAARRVGMPSSPITGGCGDFRLCLFELWPGKAALAEGIQYNLQRS